jgi:hypothetical protein
MIGLAVLVFVAGVVAEVPWALSADCKCNERRSAMDANALEI